MNTFSMHVPGIALETAVLLQMQQTAKSDIDEHRAAVLPDFCSCNYCKCNKLPSHTLILTMLCTFKLV